MTEKRQIPPVERVKDDRTRSALSAIKERLEVLDNIRGSRETSALTVQDGIDVGLIQLDQRTGIITKREEDEQLSFQDQTLRSLINNIDLITTADVGAAPVAYSQVYADSQTTLINVNKAKINELIQNLRNGLFR